MTAKIGEQVLEFYKDCPFNTYSTAQAAVENVISRNQIVAAYSDLHALLSKPTISNVLDAGCGGGWFTLSAAHYYDVHATGIDFNDSALSICREAAQLIDVNANFEKINLLDIPKSFNSKFDLVVSLGVLHHTGDMFQALDNISKHLSDKEDARLYVGLYHLHGRAPFLQYFKDLQEKGLNEEQLFEAYSELHSHLSDKRHLYSWFRDQVLHPHESQHTLEELYRWLDSKSFEIESTSINRFAEISDINELFREELELRKVSYQRNVVEKRYFPGFFTFCARKV